MMNRHQLFETVSSMMRGYTLEMSEDEYSTLLKRTSLLFNIVSEMVPMHEDLLLTNENDIQLLEDEIIEYTYKMMKNESDKIVLDRLRYLCSQKIIASRYCIIYRKI